MARYHPDTDLSPLYETMDCLRAERLISDGSLLSPKRLLWTAEHFAELQRIAELNARIETIVAQQAEPRAATDEIIAGLEGAAA